MLPHYLYLNPLEEAEALKRLIDEFTMTHQQIADAVGKSRATVSNLLRLIDLQPEVKKMLAQGQLEMGHARALLALEGNYQVAAAKKIVAAGLTVRAAEKLVKAKPASNIGREKRYIDPDTLRLQDELTGKLGAKVLIEHQSNGKGRLVISYTSLEELEGVMKRIH